MCFIIFGFKNIISTLQVHGIPIVASASDYGVGPPGPPPPAPPGPAPQPPAQGDMLAVLPCTNPASKLRYNATTRVITYLAGPASPRRQPSLSIQGCAAAVEHAEVVVGDQAASCPAIASEWSYNASTGRFANDGAANHLCLTVKPHASAKLELCQDGTDGQRFVLKGGGLQPGLVLAPGQFRAGECLAVLDHPALIQKHAPASPVARALAAEVVSLEFSLGMFMVAQGSQASSDRQPNNPRPSSQRGDETHPARTLFISRRHPARCMLTCARY